MVVDKNIAELICALEYIIGKQMYNPNSYNGWTEEEGCSFKYPVNYCKSKVDFEEHRITKTKSQIKSIAPECVGTMKYAFGSNHLYIGEGIVAALNYLEETYGIDFNELEEKKIQKRKEALFEIERELEEGKSVEISSGTYVVGIDLPIGRFTFKKSKDEESDSLIIHIENENGELIKRVFDTKEKEVLELEEGYVVRLRYKYILEK